MAYSIFMFYLLAKRHDGVHFFSNLAKAHIVFVSISIAIAYFLGKIATRFDDSKSNDDIENSSLFVQTLSNIAFFFMGICYAGLYLFLIVR